MIVDIGPWMRSWGWRQLPDLTWEKVSPSGLIIAQQGSTTWQDDAERAWGYEQFLLTTPMQ